MHITYVYIYTYTYVISILTYIYIYIYIYIHTHTQREEHSTRQVLEMGVEALIVLQRAARRTFADAALHCNQQ